ncbi:type VII secretion target [Nocardia sp. NPDC127579]|uniref:type VII secretion target n=1 Tax=Nocardia sp. NPDC127579 TaxID=3345402 RepID=UPI003630A576
MTYFDMNPDSLRRLAALQDEAAKRTQAWARPPADWLAGFPTNFGTIAHPVYRAMQRYYDARERAGNKMADRHAQAAADLRQAADSFEQADSDAAARIRQLGNNISTALPPSASPLGTDTPSNAAQSLGVGTPVISAPRPTGPNASPNIALPHIPFVPAPERAAADPTAPAMTSPVGAATPAPVSGSAGAVAAPPHTGPGRPGGGPPGPPGPAGSGGPTPPGGPGTGRAMTSPFPAGTTRDHTGSRPKGAPVHDDLTIARTLLACVLAATDPPGAGVSWAAAVLRSPSSGGTLFLTSNEGRGWLPAGVFWPRALSTPWQWDEQLGIGALSAAWEEFTDPARILVEFAQAWGPRAGADLTALVSSGPIDSSLRAQLGDAATAGSVGPAPVFDMRMPTADTVDRLGLTGSTEAMEYVAAVPETELAERCLSLAIDAHVRLARTGPAPAEAAEVAQLRDRILALLQAGQEVPPPWWDDLRAADQVLATTRPIRHARIINSTFDGHAVSGGFDALRSLAFQRRCTELVLLLNDNPSWRQLRSAVYTFEQVIRHPQFSDTTPLVFGPNTRRDKRSTIPQQSTMPHTAAYARTRNGDV